MNNFWVIKKFIVKTIIRTIKNKVFIEHLRAFFKIRCGQHMFSNQQIGISA